jgi:hypothetical protein
MEPQRPRTDFGYRKGDGPYVETIGPVEPLRDLVAEIDEDWPVLKHRGVGVDPWGIAVLVSVPFTLFFGKFVELAAVDAYGTLKGWLRRVVPGRGYVELREAWDWSLVIDMPATDDEIRAAVGDQLAAAMVRAAGQAAGDPQSMHRAILLYEAALELRADSDGVTVAGLIDLLTQLGDAASLQQAEVWYRRAEVERGLTRADVEKFVRRAAAMRELNRSTRLRDR